MKSTLFYKFLAAVLAILLVLGGIYAGKTIHETQLEVEHFRNEEDTVKSQVDDLTSKLNKNQEFLQRLESDPSFLELVAREHLNYAKPDEFVYRFDPDPLTSAPAGNLDNAHQPPAPAPSLGIGPPAASPRHN